MEELVSVIVPVYNVEQYLNKCISSICSQTYKNIEIILVNDGSTDNSGLICDEYAKKDRRIQVIHNQNGGVSSARNSGLRCAKGEFVLFVDSDDYIEEKLIEICIKSFKIKRVDMIIFNYIKETDTGIRLRNSHFKSLKQDIKSSKKKIRFITNNVLQYKSGWEPWNRMFRTKIIKQNNILFLDGVSFSEDLFFLLKYLLNSSKIEVIKTPLYHYVDRGNSAMNSISSIPMGDINRLCQNFETYILDLNTDEYTKKSIKLINEIVIKNELSKLNVFSDKGYNFIFEDNIKEDKVGVNQILFTMGIWRGIFYILHRRKVELNIIKVKKNYMKERR